MLDEGKATIETTIAQLSNAMASKDRSAASGNFNILSKLGLVGVIVALCVVFVKTRRQPHGYGNVSAA